MERGVCRPAEYDVAIGFNMVFAWNKTACQANVTVDMAYLNQTA